MYQLGLVALGGGIGASCRHLVTFLAARLVGPGFPAGTLTVNVLGGLLMGLLAGFLALRYGGGGKGLRLFLGTGVLGGFTTFSAFSLDAVLLWERGAWAAALGYVIVSVVLSIAALLAGLSLSRVFA
jgi:CrcB protein